jgi:beta-glucoside PTS system EIICBA component
MLAGLAADGSDPLLAYGGAANFAVFGVALGVALRTREPALRQLGTSGLITGLLAGISEPTVYGLLLRFKPTLAIMVLAAAVGGGLLGLGRVEATAFVGANLFTIPAMTPMGAYVLGIGVSFVLAATLVVVLGYEGTASAAVDGPAREVGVPEALDGGAIENAGPGPVEPVDVGPVDVGPVAGGPVVLLAPLPGEVRPLAEVPDPVFARGLLGPGVAIRPTRGLVLSPAAGTIRSVARAKHAIGIATDSGVHVMIHLGIDTVDLAGRHFYVLVRTGDHVECGQPIGYADLRALVADGYDTTTPVVVTNAAAFGAVTSVVAAGSVGAEEPLLSVAAAGEVG